MGLHDLPCAVDNADVLGCDFPPVLVCGCKGNAADLDQILAPLLSLQSNASCSWCTKEHTLTVAFLGASKMSALLPNASPAPGGDLLCGAFGARCCWCFDFSYTFSHDFKADVANLAVKTKRKAHMFSYILVSETISGWKCLAALAMLLDDANNFT